MNNYLLIILLLAACLGCKKESSEVIPSKTLLSKIETISRASVYDPSAKEQVLNYSTFAYDDQGRLLKRETFIQSGPDTFIPSNPQSYTLTYGLDGKISTIMDGFGNVATYTWTDQTLTATKTQVDGRKVTMTFQLNEHNLPIRRKLETRVDEITYSADQNVVQIYDGGKDPWIQRVEHDMTKFDPFSSSYELRLLSSVFTTENIRVRSKNWETRITYRGNTASINSETIVEANEMGYPTITKTEASYGGNITTRYTYVTQ